MGVKHCPYCGRMISRRSMTCDKHVGLRRLDEQVTGWTPVRARYRRLNGTADAKGVS